VYKTSDCVSLGRTFSAQNTEKGGARPAPNYKKTRHLRRMTDTTGIESTRFSNVPTLPEGYSTDDKSPRYHRPPILLEETWKQLRRKARSTSPARYLAFSGWLSIQQPSASETAWSFTNAVQEPQGSEDSTVELVGPGHRPRRTPWNGRGLPVVPAGAVC